MDISTIKLYETHEHPCSYLKDLSAKTIFVDPSFPMTAEMYSELSKFGFRRSGNHVYRPHCTNCQECIPVRIPVELFQPNRSQKRCLKNNLDIEVNVVNSIDTEEHYALYEEYISVRHVDGDMYPPSYEQYASFLTSEWGATRYLEMRANGKLLGVAVSDQLTQGLSAIYTFYDPKDTVRSLGVYAVLAQVERAKTLGLPYLYLGYWIRNCQKMRYKTQYRPTQALLGATWLTLD